MADMSRKSGTTRSAQQHCLSLSMRKEEIHSLVHHSFLLFSFTQNTSSTHNDFRMAYSLSMIALVLGRVVLAAVAWLSPALLAKGMDVDAIDAVGALGLRLFASRELVLGFALLGWLSDKQAVIDSVVDMGLIFDSMDFVAGIIAFQQGAYGLYGFAATSGGALLLLLVGMSVRSQRKM